MQICFSRLAILAALWIPLALAQTRYTVTDLSGRANQFSVAYGMNGLGDVVGDASFSAFYWSNGTMITPPALQNRFSTARGVNNLGQVVGGYENQQGSSVAYVFQNGAVTDLPLPGGTSYSLPSAINNAGQILLNARIGSGQSVFLLDGPSFQQIHSLDGSGASGNALNDSGQVVGGSTLLNHAFLWSAGQVTDLGVLPGGEAGAYSSANGINNAGQVVGVSTVAGQTQHAFLWENGVLTDLGTLPGDNRSYAASINNSGQIVGWSGMASGVIINSTRAVLWDQGAITDLNTLIPPGSGWVLDQAAVVNDRGEIAGTGHRNGVARAFVLTPVQRQNPPELVIPRPPGGRLGRFAQPAPSVE